MTLDQLITCSGPNCTSCTRSWAKLMGASTQPKRKGVTQPKRKKDVAVQSRQATQAHCAGVWTDACGCLAWLGARHLVHPRPWAKEGRSLPGGPPVQAVGQVCSRGRTCVPIGAP